MPGIGFIVIVAVLVILFEHAVTEFTPTTVNVAAAVRGPKSKELPVPLIVASIVVPPLHSW